MDKGSQKYYLIWGLLIHSINLLQIQVKLKILTMTLMSTTLILNLIFIKKMNNIKLNTPFKFQVCCHNIREEVVQLCQTVFWQRQPSNLFVTKIRSSIKLLRNLKEQLLLFLILLKKFRITEVPINFLKYKRELNEWIKIYLLLLSGKMYIN